MSQHSHEGFSDGAAHEFSPLVSQAAVQADELLQRGMNAVRHTTEQLRDQAAHANDLTVSYIRREPVKAMLFAVAAGALLVTVFRLAGRSRLRA